MLTILYRSDAATLLPFSELMAICIESARRNRMLGITGFLVEHEGTFLQVLEGEEEAVDALYARIREDTRHRNVELLLRERRGTGRSFGFWAMNVGPLNDGAFRRAVMDTPMDAPRDAAEFARRTHGPVFALDILSRAYVHACAVAVSDPMVNHFLRGDAEAVPGSAG